MKISIIGAGNTGHAAAAYFSSLNQEVTIYTRDSGKASVLQNNGIKASNKLNGIFGINAVSNITEAVEGADFICIFTKANQHKSIFHLISGLLEKNQRIIIFNGNWGAYEAKEILEDELKFKNIILAETSSMPFIANSKKTGEVEIRGIKKQIGFSTLNRSASEKLLTELKLLFPDVIIQNNIIETSLVSANPIIHVPISLFNIVRIEQGHNFKFYTDGISELSIKFIENIDKERILIGKNFGIKLPGILDTINSFWTNKYDNLLNALRQNYPSSKAPKSLDHRYITEDIPFGIIPIVKLGKLLELGTPYSDTIVSMANLYKLNKFYNNEIDFSLDRIYQIIEDY